MTPDRQNLTLVVSELLAFQRMFSFDPLLMRRSPALQRPGFSPGPQSTIDRTSASSWCRCLAVSLGSTFRNAAMVASAGVLAAQGSAQGFPPFSESLSFTGSE